MKRIFHLSSLLAFCFTLCSLSSKATAPTVITHPAHDTVCTGAHAFFVVAAIDTPGSLTMTFQWQVSTDGGMSWSDITDTTYYAGTGNDTLDVTASTMLAGSWYRAMVTNADGVDSSNGAMLTVHYPAAAITGPNAVCIGSSITLSNSTAGGTWSRLYPARDTVTPSGGVVTGIATGFDTVKYTVVNTCGTTNSTYPIRVDATATALPISGPSATCVGNVITLTNANVLGTWVWSSSNTAIATVSSAGLVTGVSWGYVVITYTFSNACNTVNSVFGVMVDTVLSAGTISGASGVCVGSWTHLTESTSGGMWLSSNSAIAVVDPSGNVTGVSPGAVTISYIVSNACGSSVATHSFTVSRTASAISGLDSVGIGFTRVLGNLATGGTWSIDDTLIATIDSTGVVTGVDTGVTNVTYTVTNYCGTSTAVITMNVGPAPSVPSITGADSVCIGANITLGNPYTGGVWHIDSLTAADSITRATINSTTGVLTGVAYGLVNVSYTYTNGFGTVTIVKPIFVNRIPVVTVTGPSSVTLGGIYQLRGLPWNGGATWTSSNPSMGTFVAIYDSLALVSHATYFVNNPGTATITYTVSNSCGTGSSNIVLSLAPAGVNSIAKITGVMNIYPNPTSGSITLNLESVTTEDASVTITNVLGEKVKELTVSTNKKFDVQLDVPAGIYMISAKSANGNYSGKITVAH